MIESTGVITALAMALFGVAAMLRLLPVGSCPECGHCRLEQLRKEAELEARAARFYGIPRCASCGRYHEPSEDHRP
ncbi:MAG: hypothetical protein A2V84_10700 [Chloroflexi bacterium RBG_16_70_13]|nr:MAG: hypothetical protein A2V84_10700 [Chloroflexi bacterium RBG_16_70_13]